MGLRAQHWRCAPPCERTFQGNNPADFELQRRMSFCLCVTLPSAGALPGRRPMRKLAEDLLEETSHSVPTPLA